MLAYRWLSQLADPRWMTTGLAGLPWYLSHWRRYRRLPGAEPLLVRDSHPQLHDRTVTTPVDLHYFHVNGWCMRRVLSTAPRLHVDVASQAVFANLLAAVVPVFFVDYRPLVVTVPGLRSIGANTVDLPFQDGSIASLSCLHAAEHVGLGRYGDPLDPLGTRKSARELARVLAPGGNLFFALPVGVRRLCFNAHRIHSTEEICEYFAELALVEFSAVDDSGTFLEATEPRTMAGEEYACGMFWFNKPGAHK